MVLYNAPGTEVWRIVQWFDERKWVEPHTEGSISEQGSNQNQNPDSNLDSDLDSKPRRHSRFALTITDPVLVPNDIDMFIQPVLDVDFGHAVWVEWVKDGCEDVDEDQVVEENESESEDEDEDTDPHHLRDERDCTPKRRLRILTFPTTPTSSDKEHIHTVAPSPSSFVRTLSVPQDILSLTTRIVLDQSLGAVLLCTAGGEMWEVRYV